MNFSSFEKKRKKRQRKSHEKKLLQIYLLASLIDDARIMWETFRDESTGKLYYGNRETKETSWSPPTTLTSFQPFPNDDIKKSWQTYRSPLHNNELFFLNTLTGERVWNRPIGYFGMPLQEEQDHDKGPFICYFDKTNNEYYYNPRTKLCTRQKPKNIVSEEVAYEELDKAGLLWKGENKIIIQQLKPTSSNEEEEEEEESSSSSEEEEEEEKNDMKNEFFQLLEMKGVTHVSRWLNWLPKLRSDVIFQKCPQDKTRLWFETYVKEQISKESSKNAAVIQETKQVILKFVNKNDIVTKLRELYQTKNLPEQVLESLDKLKENERNLLIDSLMKNN